MPEKSAANRALGEAIRSAREEAGFSQEAFAAHADVDRSYYGAIERGQFNVTLDTLVKIAKALGMTGGEMLTRAGV